MTEDAKTAEAFASSWNNLPEGSVYTFSQFEDWLQPLTKESVSGKRVLELGCGNGSLMVHLRAWNPSYLLGIDLGDSVLTARQNLADYENVEVKQEDITTFRADAPFDIVYCIGVLHHLKKPRKGFESVVENTVSGGAFHCWVYAREGNSLIVYIVDPIRKVTSRLPWRLTKYIVATTLVAPFYVYAKALSRLPRWVLLKSLPLYEYALWIGKREFAFFRHVAFDQLVTPQTTYLPKTTLEAWLQENPDVDQSSTYIIMRNGNSWKFGGKKN